MAYVSGGTIMETPDSPRNFSMSISSDEERPRCFAYEGSSGASSLRGLADDLLSDFDSPNNTSIGDIAKDLFAEIEKQPPPAPPVRQISKPVRDVRKASDSTMLAVKLMEGLKQLLEYKEGEKLFREFLTESKSEGYLLFYYACQGWERQRDLLTKQKLIKVIYSRFIHKEDALGIKDSTKVKISELIQQTPDDQITISVFDEAKQEAWEIMDKAFFPNFLKSELFLDFLNKGSTSNSGGSNFLSVADTNSTVFEEKRVPEEPRSKSAASSPLKNRSLTTLSEDEEMGSSAEPLRPVLPVRGSATRRSLSSTRQPPTRPLSLTKNALMRTKTQRDSTSAKNGAPVNPYHSQYCPVVPPSKQASEVSADFTETRSIHSRLPNQNVRTSFTASQRRLMMIDIEKNRDNDPFLEKAHGNMQKHLAASGSKENDLAKSNPDRFFKLLSSKLEIVYKERIMLERGEKLPKGVPMETQAQTFRKLDQNVSVLRAVQQRFGKEEQVADDDEQSILDLHCSKVWPGRTPGAVSPRLSPQPPKVSSRHGISGVHSGSNRNVHKRNIPSVPDPNSRMPRISQNNLVSPVSSSMTWNNVNLSSNHNNNVSQKHFYPDAYHRYNGKNIPMEQDSGVCVSVVSQKPYAQQHANVLNWKVSPNADNPEHCRLGPWDNVGVGAGHGNNVELEVDNMKRKFAHLSVSSSSRSSNRGSVTVKKQRDSKSNSGNGNKMGKVKELELQYYVKGDDKVNSKKIFLEEDQSLTYRDLRIRIDKPGRYRYSVKTADQIDVGGSKKDVYHEPSVDNEVIPQYQAGKVLVILEVD